MSNSFSDTYRDAREKFLEAADHKDLTIESHEHPLKGPCGETLATDVAFHGDKNAKKVLFVSSANHGIEGFVGSAGQIQHINETDFDKVPTDMAIVYAHAINPHGFAFERRVTEDNVDNNRNFRDWSKPVPDPHLLSDKLQNILLPKNWNFPVPPALMGFVLINGVKGIQAALQHGQYNKPDGIFYGGNKSTWSNKVWSKIVGAHTLRAEHVAAVDIHSGLGKRGHGELIITSPTQSEAGIRASQWWGDNVRSVADENNSSSSAQVTGDIGTYFNVISPEAEVTFSALEFGTISPLGVLQAMAMDNWAHAKGLDKEHPKMQKANELMRKAFAPDDPEWQSKVLEQSQRVLMQAQQGMDLG